MSSSVKLKSKFWLFASPAHDDDIFFTCREGDERFARRSRITPAEGANMLGVNNMIMVGSQGCPVAFSEDAYGYMESFCRMDKVMWSCTGSQGFRTGNEEKFIVDIAKKYPNVMGAFLDDMLVGPSSPEIEAKHKANMFSMKEKLAEACRPIELWATLYTQAYNKYTADMYEPLDGITVWNMDTDQIPKMDEDFSRYEELLPDKRKMLGLYIYDYNKDASVTIENMQHQCETGLKWLKEGRIEGMIFLTNCVMGIGLKADYWLREWIDKIGNEII